jgi:hypothetical protein
MTFWKEMAMDTNVSRPDISHKRIPARFLAVMGLSLAWFVPVGWLAFAGGVDTVLAMMLVSVFASVALALPWLLARASRGSLDEASAYRPREWLKGQFETQTGRLPARDALILILLPLASAAIGITLMGIVLGAVAAGP